MEQCKEGYCGDEQEYLDLTCTRPTGHEGAHANHLPGFEYDPTTAPDGEVWWAISAELVQQIGRVAHECNRAYCLSIGDTSQPSWDRAPEWQRVSAMKGVQFHWHSLERGIKPSPSASHESWLEEKRRDGWIWGAVKDPLKREHPCFVPYEELPSQQKMKDYLFASVVEAFWQARQ